MSRLLACPHCNTQFSFDDWARARECPSCRRRLSFFEASAAAPPATPSASVEAAAPVASAAPAGDSWTWSDTVGEVATAAMPPAPVASVAVAEPGVPPAPAATAPAAVAPAPASASTAPAPAPAAVAPAPATPSPVPAVVETETPPVADAAAEPLSGASLTVVAPASIGVTPHRVWTIGDKPLQWSRGWAIVLAIWLAVAVGLVAIRVEMGPVTVMTPAEHAAVSAVQAIRLPTGAATETVLRYAATHDLTLEGHVATIPPGGTQMWYAFDRPWERTVYVSTTLPGTSMMGKDVVLSWTVSDGVARADAATRTALAKAAQTMAHPPSRDSVPAVPGIIPSIPPGL